MTCVTDTGQSAARGRFDRRVSYECAYRPGARVASACLAEMRNEQWSNDGSPLASPLRYWEARARPAKLVQVSMRGQLKGFNSSQRFVPGRSAASDGETLTGRPMNSGLQQCCNGTRAHTDAVRMGRAGHPTTVVPFGMFSMTTAPAPTMTESPMVTC